MLVYLAGHFAISDQMFVQGTKVWNLLLSEGAPTEPVPRAPLELLQSMTSSLNPTMNVWAYVTYCVINFSPTDGSRMSQGGMWI